MELPDCVRLVTIPLEGAVSASDGALLVRGDERPFALAGAWAGGSALAGSEPLVVAHPEDDPFELIDSQPVLLATEYGEAAEGATVTGATAARAPAAGAPPGGEPLDGHPVGGGWFGWLGYGLGARLEPVPPSPPRPTPMPPFELAFYDNLLRRAPSGRWWFEALWSEERAAELERRLELLRLRLRAGVRRAPARLGTLAAVAPGPDGHVRAVAECKERIAAGEIFQANICLRLEGDFAGDPLDLFARAAGELEPAYAGVVAGDRSAVCSLSPELFLRRRGREVVSEPVKGTAALAPGGREALAASVKDRAENVMIVDLMRNDLGRVCEYGSVEVREMHETRRAPGVWHLVSTVAGRLHARAGDGDLLRAAFPPGSVTGAPKIQAMRVIAELEATGREAYTGALGYASPLAGLELNVTIRTLELHERRAWLGAGGGIVADSHPARELEECLVKARPVAAAAGGRVREGALRGTASQALPPAALSGGANRPDPALGVFSTILVRDGEPIDLELHLARLEQSMAELYGERLPAGFDERVRAAAGEHELARLRVLIGAPAQGGTVGLDLTPLQQEPRRGPVTLTPATLPGGLGAHKWRDRRLLEELGARCGGTPLLTDLDGDVLEAAMASVWIVEAGALVTPPLDGRLLPGTVRSRLLERPDADEQRIDLARMAAADEIFLSSALSGVTPARLYGSSGSRFEVGARLRSELRAQPAGAVR